MNSIDRSISTSKHPFFHSSSALPILLQFVPKIHLCLFFRTMICPFPCRTNFQCSCRLVNLSAHSLAYILNLEFGEYSATHRSRSYRGAHLLLISYYSYLLVHYGSIFRYLQLLQFLVYMITIQFLILLRNLHFHHNLVSFLLI